MPRSQIKCMIFIDRHFINPTQNLIMLAPLHLFTVQQIMLVYNNMHIQIKIEDQKFKLSIGKGYNDWVWLAHYASRVYSKTIYPQGVYIPALLYIQHKNGQYHPHPRQRIKFYLQTYDLKPQDFTAVIKVRKSNHIFTEYQRKWELQAFGQQRYFNEIKFSYKVSNINRKKDFYFKIKLHFTINDEIRTKVDPKKTLPHHEIKLEQRQLNATDSAFEGRLKLPYGNIQHRLLYFLRQSPNQEYTEIELKDHKIRSEDFKVNIEPKFINQQTITDLLQEDMKISQNINKNLQDRQLEAKKRNTKSTLCCYTFEQLWNILQQNYSKELSLEDYQQSTKQRIKIAIQKSLNSLYEIFFYYFIVQNNQKDKKEDLAVNYQHVIHFLRDYQIFTELKDILNFIEFYNSDYKFTKIQDTLDSLNFPIKFPQFVAIFLRSIQFLQTSTFMLKGQTFDSAVVKIIQKIVQIEAQLQQFSALRQSLRQNAKIISFMRSSSEQIKKIFSYLARTSIQNCAAQYSLKKQQIKRMLQLSAITEKSTDLIVEECFNELQLAQDGIFYYEFLLIMQWLAMATIASEKQEQQFQNEQEQSGLIIQKIKYFIDKIITII